MSSCAALDQALAYIESHYMDPLTLEDIVHASGVSKFSLNRLFKKYFHTPPLRWLWLFRANVATLTLRQVPDMTCREIGYACGFETPAHFARVFRHVIGQTPMAYKTSGDAMVCHPAIVFRARRAFLNQYCHLDEVLSASANT